MRERVVAVATAGSPTSRLEPRRRQELLTLLEQLLDEPSEDAAHPAATTAGR